MPLPMQHNGPSLLGVKLILAVPASPQTGMRAKCLDTTVLVMSSVPHHLPFMSRLIDGVTGRGSEPLPGQGMALDLNLGNESEVGVQIGKRRQRRHPEKEGGLSWAFSVGVGIWSQGPHPLA